MTFGLLLIRSRCMDRFFVTTPIYYVSDKPHIGHAYTTVAADVLARHFRRKLGRENVFFLTGTDEHGVKVAEAAAAVGEQPADFVTRLAKVYEDLWVQLAITPDFFVRTTDPRHEAYASKFLEALFEKGEITKGVYEGLYCVGCEKFVTESEMMNPPKGETGARCPDHPNKELIHQKEENYFFALAKWVPQVKDAIMSNQLVIAPPHRRNEILARLDQGVHDISISRTQVSWGIPVPWDTTQTIYVWFEALLNYASALEIEDKKNFWPPTVQLMGKEILWFHAVIWPAMLLAAGKRLPKTIVGHGWFTVDGQKMSKTVGNVIDPTALIEKYGVDATRFFLLRATSFGSDGDISLERFAVEYEAYLANQLGNLVQRTLTLCQKFGIVVETGLKPACAEVEQMTEALRFDEALAEIWKLVTQANGQLDQEKPWSEPDVTKRKATLVSITRQLETIAVALEPYLPTTAEKIQNQLQSGQPEALFPRL